LACNGNPVVTSLNGQPGSGVVSRFSTISFVLNGTNLMLPGLAV
jgi:hypothetical protein